MKIDKILEFQLFEEEVKKLKSVSPEIIKQEINQNKSLYSISETNSERKKIEYFTEQNYKHKHKCFCEHSATKKKYFYLEDAIVDKQIFDQLIYVCKRDSKYRIYHLTSK